MGKRPFIRRRHPVVQKHPHGRGEDRFAFTACFRFSETPPRAWGRRLFACSLKKRVGNTPTGVGKTLVRGFFLLRHQKHPHGRGEDLFESVNIASFEETPPRAWGRRDVDKTHDVFRGNTPTGVGKTLSHSHFYAKEKKHPHGRGEDAGLVPTV